MFGECPGLRDWYDGFEFGVACFIDCLFKDFRIRLLQWVTARTLRGARVPGKCRYAGVCGWWDVFGSKGWLTFGTPVICRLKGWLETW